MPGCPGDGTGHPVTLQGQHVRLEPLAPAAPRRPAGHHRGPARHLRSHPRAAEPGRARGMACHRARGPAAQRSPFRSPPSTRTGTGPGTTRYGNIEFWVIPRAPTWAAPPACRTRWRSAGPGSLPAPAHRVDTEAKRLMLAHAFERWEVYRSPLKTDARNVRSRDAIERIGAKLDGLPRALAAADGGRAMPPTTRCSPASGRTPGRGWTPGSPAEAVPATSAGSRPPPSRCWRSTLRRTWRARSPCSPARRRAPRRPSR